MPNYSHESLLIDFKDRKVKGIEWWQYIQLMLFGNTVLSRKQYSLRETIVKQLDKVGVYVLIYKSRYGTALMITKERNQVTGEVPRE